MQVYPINGGHNTLVVEAVASLEINGASNTITAASVDTIAINGADNKITWKKAKTGDAPTLKGQPDKNTITQAK